MSTWTAEDEKLVTLAKGARSRVGAETGAALRDTSGRTYSSAEVNREYLKLSAVELTVGQSIASGATGIEAVVLCTESELTSSDKKLIEAFGGAETLIYVVNLRGDRIDF